jgi:hypothetical protein
LGKKGVAKMYGLIEFAGNLSQEVTHALTALEQQCMMDVLDLQEKHAELLQEKKNLHYVTQTVLKVFIYFFEPMIFPQLFPILLNPF